jgi:DNA-binding transcriptional MerR regulator
MYEESAVPRLQFIDRAKELGLPLVEIRELIAVWDGGLCAQDRLARRITANPVRYGPGSELTGFAAQLDAARAELSDPLRTGRAGRAAAVLGAAPRSGQACPWCSYAAGGRGPIRRSCARRRALRRAESDTGAGGVHLRPRTGPVAACVG